MNQPKREPLRLSDIAPVLLVAATTMLGMALGVTHGNEWVKLGGALLLAAAFAVRYLRSRRVGLALVIGVCVAFVLTGAIFRWTFVWSWVTFVAGAFMMECLLHMIYASFDSLRRERDYQRQRSERGTLIDESSELRNLRSYQNDATIYIRIAKRHHLNLGLVLWRLDNAAALRGQLGEKEYAKLVRRISRQLHSSLRYEDMIFLIDDAAESLIWGTLHIANSDDVCAIVEHRLRAKLAKIELPEGLALQFSTRDCLSDNEQTFTPMDLLESARGKFNGE